MSHMKSLQRDCVTFVCPPGGLGARILCVPRPEKERGRESEHQHG